MSRHQRIPHLLKSSLLGVTRNSSTFPPFCCCCCLVRPPFPFLGASAASGAAVAALHSRGAACPCLMPDVMNLVWHMPQACSLARRTDAAFCWLPRPQSCQSGLRLERSLQKQTLFFRHDKALSWVVDPVLEFLVLNDQICLPFSE